jgi:hypothetical protein
MSEFLAYLQLGFDHITDANGYDHILFIMALCTVYTVVDWRKVLILVTAFTLGHSITLALATLGMVVFRPDIIELLIPVTIVATAFFNLFDKTSSTKLPEKRGSARFPLALIFGLIHGLGFSNYLRALLGEEADLVVPLLGFNLGLEFGQLLIVAIFLMASLVATQLFNISKIKWNLVLSGIIIGLAITLIIQNDLFKSTTGQSTLYMQIPETSAFRPYNS